MYLSGLSSTSQFVTSIGMQLLQHVLIVHASSRMSGTPTNRWPSVVGFFLSALSLVASNLRFSDSPEIGPGSLIGDPGSVITTPTGTSSAATIFTGVASSDPSFFSSSRGSSPNTGAIVGGVVAGVAVIAIAVLGFFYLRRRRTKAPTSAFVDEGASPPHNDGAERKLLDDSTDASLSTSEIQASIAPMRVYVRVSIPSLHSCVLM